ncbi:hypothetical protein D3C80_1928240 [compost metagenome]
MRKVNALTLPKLLPTLPTEITAGNHSARIRSVESSIFFAWVNAIAPIAMTRKAMAAKPIPARAPTLTCIKFMLCPLMHKVDVADFRMLL